MSDRNERDAQRASGTDAMASCTLTDADGNQVFVGDWVTDAKPSDSGDSEEVERRPRPRPQTKSILEHSRSLLYATAKSCGANSPGGGGFQTGNTCGGGGDAAGGGQKRAAKGGEIGPNGEFYKGGAYIATTDIPKKVKEKRNKAAAQSVYIEPGKREVPEAEKISIFNSIEMFYNWRADTINDIAVSHYRKDPAVVKDLVKRYRSGERYVDVKDYPAEITFGDAARMAKNNVPIPGAALSVIANARGVSEPELQQMLGIKKWNGGEADIAKSVLAASKRYLATQAKSAGERWITIGGNSSAPKGERGGTPVMISEDGEILKGPRDLKGENLKDLGKDSDKPKKPKKPKIPARPKITLEKEKELQAIREERDRKLIAARDANDYEARDAVHAEFRAKRKEIVGDTEERMQKWDNDRAKETIDDVRKRLKELEGKKPWEMTPEEFHLVPKIKRADQAKKDLEKWGKMLDDYAKATDARDWDAQEAAVKKLEDTRGLDALKKRTFDKADYGSIATLHDRLNATVDAIEKRPHDVVNDWQGMKEHEAEVKKQAEKDASVISVENIRKYAWAGWIPQEAKEKVATQDAVDHWQGQKDTDEFRKQAREGRKVSNLANAAVNTFREEVLQMPNAERRRLSEEYSKVYNEYEAAVAKGDIDAAMKTAQQADEMHEKLKAIPKDDSRPIDKIVQATGGKTAKFKADIEGDVTPAIQARVDNAIAWLSTAVAPGVYPETVKIKILKPGEGYHGDTRSYASEETIYLTPNAGAGVVIHEIGHVIEYANESKLGAKSEAFLAAKTFDQKVDHMGKNYNVSEVATKNGFLEAYTGKYYGGGATEILSMGLQHLYEDPVRFARESPDHFNYTTAVMRGLIE